MKSVINFLNYKTDSRTLKDIVLLLIRLIVAYGFWSPAIMKLQGLSGTADWFASMGYPLPMVSAIMAAVTEISGVFLLVIGLATRYISIPMIFIMLVAIFTVHLPNGFMAGDNGFEIPLYYIIMLLTLIGFGSGRFSIDQFVYKRK